MPLLKVGRFVTTWSGLGAKQAAVFFLQAEEDPVCRRTPHLNGPFPCGRLGRLSTYCHRFHTDVFETVRSSPQRRKISMMPERVGNEEGEGKEMGCSASRREEMARPEGLEPPALRSVV